MNILKSHKEGSSLTLKIDRALNLSTINIIESRLTKEINRLIIDLSECRFVDSEGVIFLYKWQKAGHELILKDPPDILFEIIRILKIEKDWKPQGII